MQEDQLQEGRGSGLFTAKNLLLLLIGFVAGYFLKIQAVQTITMGYDDYKLAQWQKNLNEGNLNESKNGAAVGEEKNSASKEQSENKNNDGVNNTGMFQIKEDK